MNIANARKPKERLEVVVNTSWEIQQWGLNNLYPVEMQRLIASSDTGTSCLSRYIDFITGDGFLNETFSEQVLNRRGDTADDIYTQVCRDLGFFSGLALHVNYNVMGKITEVFHVPFENCRLGMTDDCGYMAKIAVHPDWEGKKKFGRKVLKPSRETIEYIDVFNPNPVVVQQQMELAGGPENYNGQILWISTAGRTTYPVTKYDSAVPYLSAEEGLGNISCRNVRNGFYPAGMLVVKKGQNTPNPINPNTDRPFTIDEAMEAGVLLPSMAEKSDISEQIGLLQGDQNSNKIAVVELEFDEEKPEWVPMQSTNYDKEFTVTDEKTVERIYAVFQQEPFHRMRVGAVGFNGDLLTDAFEYYSTITTKERRLIERAFDQIVTNMVEPLSKKISEVKPLKYLSANASTNNISGRTSAIV